jgi:inner membrane protein
VDNLTHTLAGIAIGDVLYRKRWGRGALAVVAAAANAPDLDVALYAWGGRDAYVFEHRGPSHGVLGVAVLTLLIGAVARFAWRGGPPLRTCLAMATLGLLSHIALDVPTAWGTCVASPLSTERVALDWVFIIDVLIWAALAVPFIFKARGWEPRRASGLGLALLGIYLAFAGVVHEAVRASIARQADEIAPGRVTWLRVFPRPFAPFAWFGVARTSDERYLVWRVSVLERSGPEVVPTGLDLPELARARRESWAASRYLWWASAPRAELVPASQGGPAVRLSDLRFTSSSLYVSSFRLLIALGADGAPVNHRWE